MVKKGFRERGNICVSFSEQPLWGRSVPQLSVDVRLAPPSILSLCRVCPSPAGLEPPGPQLCPPGQGYLRQGERQLRLFALYSTAFFPNSLTFLLGGFACCTYSARLALALQCSNSSLAPLFNNNKKTHKKLHPKPNKKTKQTKNRFYRGCHIHRG